jgi:hypothetical protein
MDPHVKFSFPLDDGLIKTGQQHMIIVVNSWLGCHQQTMVFSCITMNNG